MTISAMKLKKTFISLFLSILVVIDGNSQSQRTVDSLEEVHQNCLDQGENMLGCTYLFYDQMDSLLNVVYIRLYKSLDIAQKARLKTDQKKWLLQRNLKFKKADKELQRKIKDGIAGNDDVMMETDDQAHYIKERVETLLKMSSDP